MSKSLIVYFSHNKENYFSGNIVNLEKGNVQVIAETLSTMMQMFIKLKKWMHIPLIIMNVHCVQVMNLKIMPVHKY